VEPPEGAEFENNVGSRRPRQTIAHELLFSGAEDLAKTQTGSPPTEAPNAGGVGNVRQITRYNSETATAANVVNLVRSHVYHTERPPLFAARLL